MAYNSFSPTTTTEGSPLTATNSEAVSGVVTNKMVVPSNLSSVFASPPAIGGTAQNTARFTSLGVNSSILNIADFGGNIAIGSYAGANSAPSNGMIVSGFSSFGSPSNSELMRVQVTNDSDIGLRVTDGTNNGNIVIQPLTGSNAGFTAINFNGYFSSTEQRYNTSKNRYRLYCDQRSTADQLAIDTYNGTTITNLIVMSGTFVGIGATTLNYRFEVSGGDIAIMTAGRRFRIAEGTNACMGVSTLVGGTVTVSNTSVGASSRIFLTHQNSSGTRGSVAVTTITAGTSFVITSTSATDTSNIAWIMFNPS